MGLLSKDRSGATLRKELSCCLKARRCKKRELRLLVLESNVVTAL